MALSLLNHLVWDIPDAQIPFLIGDAMVLGSLYFVERGMKAERELRELKAVQEVEQQKEVDKAEHRAQKQATRHVQKQAHKVGKQKTSNATKKYNIQQPSKNS